MAVSNQQVQSWLAANPTATDTQIRSAMDQYGVNTQQMAQATGLNQAAVQSRYNAAAPAPVTPAPVTPATVTPATVTPAPGPVSPQAIQTWFAQNPGASDTKIRQAMDQYGVGTEQLASAMGFNPTAVQSRYADSRQQLGTDIKSGLASMLVDKNLSFDEAAQAMKFARENSLNPQAFSELTGYDPRLYSAIESTLGSGIGTLASKYSAGELSAADTAKAVSQLGRQYGLSDADIAKYTGGLYSTEDVSGFMDPVRNFGKSLQPVLQDRNATPESIRAKIAELSSNPIVAELYAPQIAQLNKQLDSVGDKWETGPIKLNTKSGQNVLQAENLYSQIAGIRDAVSNQIGKNYWGGEGYGNLDENTQAFTQRLMEKGVTDLRQLGVREEPVLASGEFSYSNGQWQQAVETPRLFGEVGDTETQMRPVQDSALIAKLEAQRAKDGSNTVTTEYATGEKAQQLVNKETGEVIPAEFWGDNTFRIGYTTKGEGMVHYNLAMQPKVDPATGETTYTPIPVQQPESTSDLGDIAPILAFASFIPGVAPFAMAANAAIAASQGNWLGAITSGLGAVPGLSAAAGAPLATGTVQTMGNVASGLRTANALASGDYLGAITSAGNMAGAGNITVPGTEGTFGADGLQLGELSKGIAALGALAQGQVLPGVLAGADLAGVKDIMGTGIAPRDVASAANVAQALQSDNPAKIIQTLGKTGQNYGVIPKMASGGLASLVG